MKMYGKTKRARLPEQVRKLRVFMFSNKTFVFQEVKIFALRARCFYCNFLYILKIVGAVTVVYMTNLTLLQSLPDYEA